MMGFIIAHWKGEALGLAIISILTLLANEVTSPKILAAMVYLSDWNMLWTWEWWTRWAIYLVAGGTFLWLQKRKYSKQLLAQETLWHKKVEFLEAELKHAQVLLGTALARLEIRDGRRGL